MAIVPFNSDTLANARNRARGVLSQFTLGQKMMTGLALVALVAGAAYFMHVESQPNYQPLFTNLQASDAGAITAQLTADHVPYQLGDGGSTVLVPAADVDEQRVALAEQGLPDSGTVGFTNLEKSGITTSQFVQQVEYQQALEGQLEQVIESISGVQSAQVSLVVPQSSDFAVGTTEPTTASILVDLAPGASLSGSQVSAIEHLAASATPGLSIKNVTVVDNNGQVLSASSGSGATGSSDAAETTAYDNQLESSLQTLLDRVVGVGNAAVAVHAQLNFNQQSTVTKGLQTNAAGQAVVAPTSTDTTNESYKGTGSPPSGLLGAGQTSTTGSGTSTSTSSDVTNAVGEVTETVKQAPGQVVSTSVAVLLNADAKPKPSAKKIQSLIAAAAGLNKAAGDQLVVTALPFAKASPTSGQALASGTSRLSLIEHGGALAALVLLILAMLFLALRATRRPIYDEVRLAEVSTAPMAMLSASDEALSLGAPAVGRYALTDFPPDAVVSQVDEYIRQNPAEVARLLRAWADEAGKESV